jgi:PKD repeat protein
VAASGSTPGSGGPCAPIIPDGNVYITLTGNGCDPISGNCSGKAADVAFQVNAVGYDFACANHTYSWDFGDGGHSTEKAPSHKYTANGTYHVKLHFSNGAQPVDLNATVNVTGVGPVIPPRHRSAGH